MAALSARQVVAAVCRHYGGDRDSRAPEWALLSEFALAPGLSQSRIDLMCVRAWRSGIGMERRAIEVKVTRADLRAELGNPAKARPFEAIAHRFYLATPAGLVPDLDSLPAQWGLYEISRHGGSLRCMKRRAAALQEPEPMAPEAFVEAFRRASHAEGRIRRAEPDDPAAALAGLRRDVARAKRAEERARSAARRDGQRLRTLLGAVSAAGGFRCVCGALVKNATSSRIVEHSDGSSCPEGRFGYPEVDYADLAARLGLPAVLEGSVGARYDCCPEIGH